MNPRFTRLKIPRPAYRVILAVLAVPAALGGGAAHPMYLNGPLVRGMNTQEAWGIHRAFALALILAACAAVNAASLSSAFNLKPYQPRARLSALLAMALLLGGLAILVLDLGRPDRLLVALTHYNFK